MTVKCTVTCIYHRPGKKGQLVIHSRQRPEPNIYAFIHGDGIATEVKLSPTETDVSFWIYLQRTIDTEGHHVKGDPEVPVPSVDECYCHPYPRSQLQMYTCRIGTVCVGTLGNGIAKLYDSNKVECGMIELEGFDRTLIVRELSIEITAATQKYKEQVAHDHHITESNINQSLLKTYHFAVVNLPCGIIRSWAFFSNILRTVKADTHDYQDIFNRFFYLACFYLLEDADSVIDGGHRNSGFVAELIAEMQTMETRAVLYVADTSLYRKGDRMIDDWADYGDQPNKKQIALDCEDLAAHVMRRSFQLKYSIFTKPWLLALQKFERQYTTYTAIMSLDIQGTMCYHVALLKLDSRYHFDNEEENKYLPSVFIDSTIYSTSCGEFGESKYATEACYKRSQESGWPWQSQTKVPNSILRKRRVYGHVVIIFCPEKPGSVRMDLMDHETGKRGVLLSNLLRYAKCRVKRTPFDESALLPFGYMPKQRPPLPPDDLTIPAIVPKTITSAPLIDLTFRELGWNKCVDNTLKHDKGLRNAKVQFYIFKLEITKGLFIERVMAFTV